MVRFSDMLGGSGDADSPRATKVPGAVPYVAPAPGDDEPDDEPELTATATEPEAERHETPSADDSPQDVLDRLTQYATSTRAADQVPAPAADAPAPAIDATELAADAPTQPTGDGPDLSPVGDDLLPKGKRTGRRAKRRP